MFAPHLVGVTERIVGSVNDDLGVIMRIRTAVNADQTTAAVVFRQPRSQIQPGWRDGVWHYTHPGFVTENGTVLTDENSTGEPILDSLAPGTLVPVRGTFLESLLIDSVFVPTPAPGETAATARRLSLPPGFTSASAGMTMADRYDAVLYLGPFRSLTRAPIDIEPLRRDPALVEELQRRSCLVVGRALDTAAMFRAPPREHHPGGRRRSYLDLRSPTPPPSAPPPLPSPLPEPCGRLLGERR